jgi:N-acetylglucosaminyldiphosphoundecaprenol N-acetyl-beta-D-mannosaminyltransferase
MIQSERFRKLSVILGIPIDNLDFNETLDLLCEFVVSGRQNGKGHQVATANVDFLVKAQSDRDLRSILRKAHLVTADGMPLVWGSRLLGVPSKGRVPGSDIVPQLVRRAAEKGYSIFLLGAAPHVAKRAAEMMIAENPGLNIVGVVSPPITPVDQMDPAIIEQIKMARPDILLVAFGNPKQEKWISWYGKQVNVPVMMGIGGTLDFMTGTTKRAPVWMHGIGLEWVYRLLREPRRLLKRYGTDLFVFNSAFFMQYLLDKTASLLNRHKESQLKTRTINHKTIIDIQGTLTVGLCDQFRDSVFNASATTTDLILNMEPTTWVDNYALGTLIDAANQVHSLGLRFTLVSVPKDIARALVFAKLDEFFEIVDTLDAALFSSAQTVHAMASTTE